MHCYTAAVGTAVVSHSMEKSPMGMEKPCFSQSPGKRAEISEWGLTLAWPCQMFNSVASIMGPSDRWQ